MIRFITNSSRFPGIERSLHLVPRLLAYPERVPVHLWSGDGQGLEEVDPALRQVHEASPDQGNSHHAPSNMRLRRMQDFITGGKSKSLFLTLAKEDTDNAPCTRIQEPIDRTPISD